MKSVSMLLVIDLEQDYTLVFMESHRPHDMSHILLIFQASFGLLKIPAITPKIYDSIIFFFPLSFGFYLILISFP